MIKWCDIEAECSDFRSGFVAVFRKYEGMDTDEKTAQDRIVKVTMSSFARHMGIGESTFRSWVKNRDRGGGGGGSRNRDVEAVKRTLDREPEKLIKSLTSKQLDTLTQVAIDENMVRSYGKPTRKPREVPSVERLPFNLIGNALMNLYSAHSKLQDRTISDEDSAHTLLILDKIYKYTDALRKIMIGESSAITDNDLAVLMGEVND